MANWGSTVVVAVTHNPKFVGSNPGSGGTKKFFWASRKLDSTTLEGALANIKQTWKYLSGLKHSSLFCPASSDKKRKRFYNIDYRKMVQVVKL